MSTLENNRVTLVGTILTKLTFDHEVAGEKFHKFFLSVDRASEKNDLLPVVISERAFEVTDGDDFIGCRVRVEGSFRSFSLHENGKHSLILTVFADQVNPAGDAKDYNEIVLEGFLCKQPIYRKTPLGREIADCLVAVNRPYGKSDYIPCLAWGRNANYMSSFEAGVKIRLEGRIQSRTFQKKLSETEFEERVAYEVSMSKFEILGANR